MAVAEDTEDDVDALVLMTGRVLAASPAPASERRDASSGAN